MQCFSTLSQTGYTRPLKMNKRSMMQKTRVQIVQDCAVVLVIFIAMMLVVVPWAYLSTLPMEKSGDKPPGVITCPNCSEPLPQKGSNLSK